MGVLRILLVRGVVRESAGWAGCVRDLRSGKTLPRPSESQQPPQASTRTRSSHMSSQSLVDQQPVDHEAESTQYINDSSAVGEHTRAEDSRQQPLVAS